MARFALILKLVQVSLLTALQYRANFMIEGGMALFWLVWNIAPVVLVFLAKPVIAGWHLMEAMLVVGWFLVLQAILEGVINPNLVDVVERIRKGTLDFVLLKPADAQLLVSFTRVVPSKFVDFVGGILLIGVSCHRLGIVPSPREILQALLLLGMGTAILYSLWLIVISMAFWFVKIDNLSYLFAAIFDAGRWPIQVFKGIVRVLLTFVVPVGLITSYPAMALLGMLSWRGVGGACVLATLFVSLSRFVWRFALAHYTSASS
ncbi:MAG: ABC transporter permease [Deltaproteobacteria bacterium]|nr:MAG: ABC transporter permease [Deltaproteobacteria bacterium]